MAPETPTVRHASPSEGALRARVRRHNAVWLTLAILLIPTAIALWLGSFWVFRVLVALALYPWVDGVWTISFWVTMVAMGLLAVEGVRDARTLFDVGEYARSVYNDNLLTDTDTGEALSAHAGNPLGVAWVVSQALFMAPRCTVEIFRAFRRRVRAEPRAIRQAAEILGVLTQEPRWVPISRFPGGGEALFLLDRLELIRRRMGNAGVEVRLR